MGLLGNSIKQLQQDLMKLFVTIMKKNLNEFFMIT